MESNSWRFSKITLISYSFFTVWYDTKEISSLINYVIFSAVLNPLYLTVIPLLFYTNKIVGKPEILNSFTKFLSSFALTFNKGTLIFY